MSAPGPVSLAPFYVPITVALWTELFIYGIYTTLFMNAMYILWTKRLLPQGQSGGVVFLYMTLLMYALVTVHIGLTLFRYVQSFILVPEPFMKGVELFDFQKWDTILNFAVFSVLTWLGDALVIYRCFYVWNRNCMIIFLPVLMLATFIGLGLYMVITINLPHPPGVDPLKTTPPQVLQTMYPLVVAQNILTTGLIGFKIWQQHRLSAAYGIVDRNSPLSLIRILRIIVESALIYTVQIIVYMILFYIQSPWGIVVQNMIVPSLGIVFVLMSLRVHYAKENSERGFDSTFPHWMGSVISSGSPVFTDPRSHRSHPTLGVVSLPVSGDANDQNAIPLEPFAANPPEKLKGSINGL